MIKYILLLTISFLLFTSISNSQSGAGANGTGSVNITVEYPALVVKWIPGGNGTLANGGIGDGKFDAGDFYPPALSECIQLPDGNFYKGYGGWDGRYIPFVVEGALGASISWSLTAPVRTVGNPGVEVTLGNLKGSTNGIFFEPIPNINTNFTPTARLNNAEGKYYIQMHFSTIWIGFACSPGYREFESVLSCEYN